MTIKEIYREYLQKLQQIYTANEAAVITDWVFESKAGVQRSDIIRSPGLIMNPAISQQLNDCLTALLQHKPVQYILGEAWFYKMKLTVNEHVLIPRPETEELVQLVVEDFRKANHSPAMMDIGTGSGCIAVALKKSLPNVTMLAIDVSAGALDIARENALNHEADIQFLQVDFLEESNWQRMPSFDVIISNPPYIPLNEKDKLDFNVVNFEPHTALFVADNTPLLFYEKIIAFGKNHLKENGKLYVEVHEDLAEKTANIFKEFYTVEMKTDIFGKERMLVAVRHRQ
ncbi:MAG: peptide chain release factor N(5)-glutamine methyltransferase [Ferruginibacter sp.]